MEQWAIPEKKKQGGVEDKHFQKKPLISLQILRPQNQDPWKFHKHLGKLLKTMY